MQVAPSEDDVELKKFTQDILTEELKEINERDKNQKHVHIVESGIDEFHRMSMIYMGQLRQDVMLMCAHAGRKNPNDTDIEFLNRFR